VAMHAVRVALLERQAGAVGVPLLRVDLPYPCSNDQYAAAVRPVLGAAAAEAVPCMAFGDLFLEDVRRYRVALLAGHPIEPVFPIWGRDTADLADEMLDAGLDAYLTCVDPRTVPRDWAGRRFSRALLAELPEGVDPCGENGEFHTFATAGPMFERAVPVRVGAVSLRDGFAFADPEAADAAEAD